MEIIIKLTAAEAQQEAATILRRLIQSKPDSVLGLATGSTPIPVYAALVQMHARDELDFSRIVTFNLDEYVGLAPDHPCSYREFMRLYPTRPEMPDATYGLAETFAEEPDSALAYYRQVYEKHRTSSRAPTALYKTGLLLERRRDRAGAREAYQRILQQYPRSNEMELARGRLAALQP